MGAWHSGNSRDLCIVSCRRWSGVMICPWLRSGRHTCYQIIALVQFLRSTFWKGHVCYRPLRKSTAASSAKNSVGTVVVSLRISWAPFSRQLLRVLQLARGSVVSVIGGDDYSAFHLFGQLLHGLLELGWVRGSENEPAKAEFHSFVREERQVETSSHKSRAPINSVFAFCNQPSFRSRRNLHKVGILCFWIFLIVSWFNTCAALDLSIESTSGKRSFGAASPFYCVAGWGCDRPWEGEGGSGVCAGLCVSSLVHTEKFFLWDWDQHAKHCCHCRRCCPKQR